MVTVHIARIDLERVVDLSQREIVPSFVHVNDCEQAVGAGRCGIERQRFLRERLGLLELFLPKFGPSRHDGLEMRAAERRISRSVVGIEIDRALEKRGRFVVLVAAYMRQELATAQEVFVGGEIVGRFCEDALLLRSGSA
jgi:hypothetical protein